MDVDVEVEVEVEDEDEVVDDVVDVVELVVMKQEQADDTLDAG